jgi:RNase H-fold protein (predicted Holliday junction resolvase)
MEKNRYILGIDPGNYKIGIAILDTRNNTIIYKNITKIFNFLDVIQTMINEYEIIKIVLGNGTGYKKVLFLINSLNSLQNFSKNLSVEIISEHNTTFQARKLYINEAKNWLAKLIRFIKSFFIDIDDYSAIVILQKYLANLNKIKNINNIPNIETNKDNS